METKIYADEKTDLQMEMLDLNIEELEPIVAPGAQINHNETLATDVDRDFELDLDVEELESIVAPGVHFNHNEVLTPIQDIDVEIEELEQIISPGVGMNHNEAFDSEALS